MEEIRKAFYLATLAVVVVFIHLTLSLESESYSISFWPYVIGFFGSIIFMAFCFYNFDKVRKGQTNQSFFWDIIRLIIRSFSYWVMVVLVYLFGWNFFNSLFQLSLSETEISKKFLANNPYLGQSLIMIISLILLALCLKLFYKIIRK